MLRDWRAGNADALGEILPLAYDELRRLAGHYLRGERRGHSLQPTALVHEAFLKLSGNSQVDWQCRAHFISVAATLMRRVLVDHARARGAEKRGAGTVTADLDKALEFFDRHSVSVLDLELVLLDLERMDRQQAKIVELRVYGGLTVQEAAEVLGISERTVKRDWASARAWLRGHLRDS